MPLRREPTPGGRRCAISLSEAQRYGRSRQGWALPPPRRCQSDMNQPDQTSIRRVHARQPVHDSATIDECESSAGGGSGVLAQQCSGGPRGRGPAGGGAAGPPRHSQRTCVCVRENAIETLGGATFSSLRPAQFVRTRHGESGVARCTRAPSRCRAFGTRPPALGPFGCVGG